MFVCFGGYKVIVFYPKYGGFFASEGTMDATLKNGKTAVIRPASEEDAEGVIAVLQHADTRTR